MSVIRSLYGLIVIIALLGDIYIAEAALNGAGGLFHFALLFTLPIVFAVAWYVMVKDYEK
jgi:hypothetical protein